MNVDVAAIPAELSATDYQQLGLEARRTIVRTIAGAQAGHLGGPLSAVEILLVPYFDVMRVDPDDPNAADRDRFILSKGHSSIALYTVLAMRGYFPVEELVTFDQIDSRLQGHPDMTKTPGVDMSTGSLGLGFSAAVGMAEGARLTGQGFTTYVLVGDGECNEGVIWEGADVAARHKLDNLVAIVDVNGLQQHGSRDRVTGEQRRPYASSDLARRWAAFGWHVVRVDGHDPAQLREALRSAGDRSGSRLSSSPKP